MIQLDMSRDAGVQADYVDRAFRKEDDKLVAASATRTKLGLVLSAGDARRQACEALEAVQAARPKKPPGRR